MKRLLLYCLTLIGFMPVRAQDDPVLMQVAGNDIHRSEFEYFFFKNNTGGATDPGTLAEFADLYVNFKLKVADAKSLGLDTMSTFQREFREYRNKDAESVLVDTAWLELQAKRLYREALEELGPDGLLKVSIMTLVPENESEEAVQAAAARLDSIRSLVLDGENFHQLAMKYSQDVMASEGGRMGWTGRPEMPEYLADIVFALEPGEVSKPCITDNGCMLFYIEDQRQLDPYETQRAQIYEYMHDIGIYERAKLNTARIYADKHGWEDLSNEAALARMDSLLEEIYPDFGNISREYYEGLLLFEISNRRIWSSVSRDTARIEEWFVKNRKKYAYDEPVFNGCITYCKTEADFNELKARANGVALKDLPALIDRFNQEKGEERVHYQTGPFRKGISRYCDAAAFGGEAVEPLASFPFLSSIGVVSTLPDTWTEVGGAVISDCQDNAEKEWIESLRKQYPYKVNKKVLNTVGKH